MQTIMQTTMPPKQSVKQQVHKLLQETDTSDMDRKQLLAFLQKNVKGRVYPSVISNYKGYKRYVYQPPEWVEDMKILAKTHNSKQLSEMLSEKYGYRISRQSIKYQCERRKIKLPLNIRTAPIPETNHNNKKFLTDAHRAWIANNQHLTLEEQYIHLRDNMNYGSTYSSFRNRMWSWQVRAKSTPSQDVSEKLRATTQALNLHGNTMVNRATYDAIKNMLPPHEANLSEDKQSYVIQTK